MNSVEILGNIALLLGTVSFLGACLWVVYDLEKGHKKRKKIKKA